MANSLGQPTLHSVNAKNEPPSVTTMKRTTKGMGKFPLDGPQLALFATHLSHPGKGDKKAAPTKEILTDVSKYLFYAHLVSRL